MWREAGRLAGGGGVEGELARERERSAHLERLLSALSGGGGGGTPNGSIHGSNVSISQDDAEPMGSQESPYRPLAQPVPPSPVQASPLHHSFLRRHHVVKRDFSGGVRRDFSSLLPPSPVVPGPEAGYA